MIVDLFAGPGGWDQGMTAWPDLHAVTVGFERDQWACRTRAAAGHHTIRADIETWPVDHMPQVDGLIASPPCQTFSAAGNGDGANELDRLVDLAHRGALWPDGDPRTRLVLEPLRWVRALRPRWVAFEQVPPVLPVWHAAAHWLTGQGYSTWTGVLCAADYGVPQTRRRAFLMASLDRPVAPPEPTHGRNPTPGLFGTVAPWVTMADALGWPTHVALKDKWVIRLNPGRTPSQPNRRLYDLAEPAPTIAFGNDASSWAWEPGDGPHQTTEGSHRVTLAEAAVLQSFPPDYPFRGPKGATFLQNGNAVPPMLARAVIAQLVDAP